MLLKLSTILLKLLLGFLGSNIDREAKERLADYNRQKAEAEAERAKSEAEVERLKKENERLESERRELAGKAVLIAGQLEEIDRELVKLSHETFSKLLRIDRLSDGDVLRSDF